MSDGHKYYTVDFENLSEDNIKNDQENLIKPCFWFDDDADINLRELGLCFDTQEEAIEKAKQIYYKWIWERNTLVCKDSSEAYFTIRLRDGHLFIDHHPMVGERCTVLREQMEALLDNIGPVNVVKYVLDLHDILVYIPVAVD